MSTFPTRADALTSHSHEVARSADAVNHFAPHPDLTPATQSWAADQTLHLAAVYSNPVRFDARRKLFNNFRRHVSSLPNVKLYAIEVAYGTRAFQVTSSSDPYDIQLRTTHEMWHKENAINLAVQRFDPGWKYGGYCDGDFQWTCQDIALETIQQLQHYDWVQMFSSHSNLGPNHEHQGVGNGFVYALARQAEKGIDRNAYAWPGSPGGAWAFRRPAFDAVGGLLETCILGSADYFMARALVGATHTHEELYGCGHAYASSILTWHRRAQALKHNVGYVDAHAVHHFHGPTRNRGYSWRWQILRDHHFDPYTDVFRDHQGLLQLTPDKPNLRDAIRSYFRQRNEDSIEPR